MPWSSCDEREAEAWGACRISLVQGSWIGVARLQRPAVRATPLTPPPGLCSQNAPARTGTGTRHWGGGCSAPSERTAALGVPRDGSREVLEWVSEGLLPPSLLLVGVEQPGARAQDGGFCSRPPSDSPILANLGGVGTVGPGQSAWVLILGASQGAAVTVPPPPATGLSLRAPQGFGSQPGSVPTTVTPRKTPFLTAQHMVSPPGAS